MRGEIVEGLAFLRDELGYSRDELAKSLSVSPQALYSWEEAKYKPIPLEADKTLRSLFN
jgi:DNA-binding XRE family transcriptional regulator